MQIEKILTEFLNDVVNKMNKVSRRGVTEGNEAEATRELAGEIEGLVKEYGKRITDFRGHPAKDGTGNKDLK